MWTYPRRPAALPERAGDLTDGVRYLTVGRPEKKRQDFVLALALTLISLVVANLGVRGQLSITLAMRSTVLAPFLAAQRVFERSADLSEQVEVLTDEREELSRQLLGSADLAEENRQLREIVGLPDRVFQSYRIGEVVPGAPAAGGSHTFLFRTGEGPGPVAPTGVISPRGIVGVLRSTRGRTGLGEFWTHPDFRVAVRTIDGLAAGIVRPEVAEGGDILMLLEGVPYQTEIREGTLLVTSGVGGVHPVGVRVGTVLAEKDARSGWSHSYLVEPSVRPGQVRVALSWVPPGGVADGATPVPDSGPTGDAPAPGS